MLPSWERVLYFHFLPAILDGFIVLAGILLILRLFRVRNPSARTILLFVTLIRPLLVFLEGSSRLNKPTHVTLGFRIPDPLNFIHTDFGETDQYATIVPWLIALLVLLALLAAIGFLMFRWLGFMAFYKKLRRRSRRMNEVEDQRFGSIVRELSRKMELKEVPEILVFRGNWATPCAIGWRRPALVIDPDLVSQFEPAELRAIIAHELSHIRRGDCLWHWVSIILRDIQSLNPFCHLSHNRIALEREKACDKEAIEVAQIPPRLLAECLVKISKLLLARQSQPLPGYGMGFVKGSIKTLDKRVRYMLSFTAYDALSNADAKRGLGIIKIAGLILTVIPLIFFQFYIAVWIGSVPIVIK